MPAGADQLAKLEEELSSTNPNIRLASLESAMNSASVAMREKALSLAFLGKDDTLKSIALRYSICAKKSLTLSYTAAPDTANSALRLNYGTGFFNIFIDKCDPASGNFISRAQYYDKNYAAVERDGYVSGTLMQFSFAAQSKYSGNITNECYVKLKLQNGKTLSGQMSCSFENFGPVLAEIYLR